MSGFSMWDADDDVQNAPQRQARTASMKLTAAINDVRAQYGDWILASSGKDEFEDRWHFAKADIRATVNNHVPPVTGIMRRVHDALKRELTGAVQSDEDNDTDETKKPKGKGDEPKTITKHQENLVSKGDYKSTAEDVDSNNGDGSDASGKNPNKKASLAGARDQDLQEGREVNVGKDLIPSEHNDYDTGESVEDDFGQGGDTGRDKHGMVVDLYQDWANGNGMRVASLNTLEQYADTGISDRDYFHLSNLIRQASEDCDCDDDEEEKSDPEDSSPADDGGDDSESESDDSGDESDSDSDGGNPFEGGDDDSDSEPAEDDGGEEADPFGDGGDDEGAPVADAEDDGGDDSGFDAPDSPPDFGDDSGGDPAGDPAAAGPPQEDPSGFDAPDGPPDFSDAPPLAQDDFSSVDEYAPEEAAQLPAQTELVPVEQIEDALGLPPGTLEQILMEKAHGGEDPTQPPGPPGGGDPRMGRRNRRRHAAEGDAPDPSGGADPAAGGQAVAPAAGGAAAPAGPDDSALLDQASEAMTSLVDQKTQEYQTLIDPLQQALQAIQFAQEVTQAANPLDVTPPEGTVDVGPGAQTPATPPGQPAPVGQGTPAPAPAQPQQQVAFRIAKAYDLSEAGYRMTLEAMGRKQYQHVAEAIQTLPPEHRIGLASSLADMFKQDNTRFNPGVFLQASGVDPHQVVAAKARSASNPKDRAGDSWAEGRDKGWAEHGKDDLEDRDDEHTASRRPFARRSHRTAGEAWNDGAVEDTYKPPKAPKPNLDDGIAQNNLPPVTKNKLPVIKGGGVAEDYMKAKEHDREHGLSIGGDAEIDGFFQKHKGYGHRAEDIVHRQEGIQPHKMASFFTRKVAGWDWDDHLNGYITAKRKPFICTTANCSEQIPTPSHTQCKCGKLWNTYAIGDNSHLASDSAQMYIAREIPIREGVIMANRKMAESEDQDYAEDLDWIGDEDIEDAEAPHAPGKTAAQYGEDDHNPVDRDGEKYCSQCDAMLWDPNIHHCPVKQAAMEKLDDDSDGWKTHSEDDNAGYKSDRTPPSTEGKQPPRNWADRGPEKGPAGQFRPNTFKNK